MSFVFFPRAFPGQLKYSSKVLAQISTISLCTHCKIALMQMWTSEPEKTQFSEFGETNIENNVLLYVISEKITNRTNRICLGNIS